MAFTEACYVRGGVELNTDALPHSDPPRVSKHILRQTEIPFRCCSFSHREEAHSLLDLTRYSVLNSTSADLKRRSPLTGSLPQTLTIVQTRVSSRGRRCENGSHIRKPPSFSANSVLRNGIGAEDLRRSSGQPQTQRP